MILSNIIFISESIYSFTQILVLASDSADLSGEVLQVANSVVGARLHGSDFIQHQGEVRIYYQFVAIENRLEQFQDVADVGIELAVHGHRGPYVPQIRGDVTLAYFFDHVIHRLVGQLHKLVVQNRVVAKRIQVTRFVAVHVLH